MPASVPDRPPQIVIRADGSASIGLGHVMRSLTLARALCDLGCLIRFEGAGVPDQAKANLPSTLRLAERSEVQGDTTDAASVAAAESDLVILDGYHFTAEFFRALEDAEVRYAIIDDNGETSATAPVLILNQNPHANAEMYRHMRGEPELLLGLEYALIRPEITVVAHEAPPRIPATVLIAMGGSDPLELTAPIAEAVASTTDHVLVALGPAHPSSDVVVQRLAGLPNVTIIEPHEYVRALATTEVAVLAAGSSLWEAACLGTPTIGIVVAQNQASAVARSRSTASSIDARTNPAVASSVSELVADLLVDRQARTRLSEAGQQQVNAGGAARTAGVVFHRVKNPGADIDHA